VAAGALRSLLWWRPPCLLRRVVVNLTHDESSAIEGLLWQARGPWLTLKEAKALKASHPATDILGEVVIHRSQVSFLQVLP